MGQVAASFDDMFQQLKMVRLPVYYEGEQESLNLPASYTKRTARSAWTNDFPLAIYSTVTIFAAVLASAFVGVALTRRWKDVSAELKVICIITFLGFLLNALICGALSGPHERYQARLTWLLPLGALILYYELYYEKFSATRGRVSSSMAGNALPFVGLVFGGALTVAWVAFLVYVLYWAIDYL